MLVVTVLVDINVTNVLVRCCNRATASPRDSCLAAKRMRGVAHAPRSTDEDAAHAREMALEELEFVVGCHSLRLLTDPKNIWGRSTVNLMQTKWCNTGNRLWPAAAALSTFLAGLEIPAGSTVIELGAGLGAVGMVLAMAGNRVVITDQQQMLPLLIRNIQHQFGSIGWESGGGAPDVRELSWASGSNASLHGLPERYEYVVASDVLYDEDSFEVLRETIERVAGPGATVVIAVHERPAAHAFFLAPSRFRWSLARELFGGPRRPCLRQDNHHDLCRT